MQTTHLKPIGVAATVIAGLTVVAGNAAAEPRIREFSAKINGPSPTIYVEAKNGKWQRISNRPVYFQVRVDANARGVSNYIKKMGTGMSESFGMTEDGQPGTYMSGLAVKTFGGRGDRNRANATLDVAKGGRELGLGKASEDAIVRACNARLTQGKSVFNQQRTTSSGHVLWAGVLTQYYRGGFVKGTVGEKRNIGIGFNVICLPDTAPYKTLSAKLDYSMTGNACPRKLTIRTVVESNRPGTGHYRRERKGGPPSAWIAFKTKQVGNRYLFVKHDTQEVGNVDQVRRIRIKNGPAAPWKRIKVDCDKFKVTHAKLSYKVKQSGACPRPMTTRMAVHANQKGHAWVRHERKGGAPGKWFKVTFKKSGKSYVWSSKNAQKVGKVDQTRRLKVKNGPASAWVHFKNDCTPPPRAGHAALGAGRRVAK